MGRFVYRHKQRIEITKDNKIKITEKMVRSNIVKYLKQMGIRYTWNLQTMGCDRGKADMEIIVKKRHIHIEVKRPGGTQSPYQKDFQQWVESEGEIYILADDFEQVVNVIHPLLGYKLYRQRQFNGTEKKDI